MNGGNSESLRYTIASFAPRVASRGAGGCSVEAGAAALAGTPFSAGGLFRTFCPEVAAWPCRGPPCQPWVSGPCGAWPHPSLYPPACPYPGPQLWQALPFPAWEVRLPSQRREYSFIVSHLKTSFVMKLEKASLMAGLLGVPLLSHWDI